MKPFFHQQRPKPQSSRGTATLATGVLLVALTSTLLAACASSGSSPASGASAAAAASYNVMFMDDLSGNSGANLPTENEFKGAVAAVNHRGGIKGHPLNVTYCDTQLAESAAVTCAQQAASDHAIAVIGNNTETSQWPYLDQAGISDFNFGGSSVAWTSSASVVPADIALPSTTGLAGILKTQGCTSFDVISETFTPSFDNIRTQQTELGAQKFGLPFKGAIYVPATAPDMAPYVTEAVNKGVDCITTIQSGAAQISSLNALLPVVKSGQIKFLTSDVDSLGGSAAQAQAADPIIKQLGTHVGILQSTVPALPNSADSQIQLYLKDENAYGPHPSDLTSETELNWAFLQLIVQAGNAIYPKVTAKGVADYVNNLKSWAPGVIPPVSFTAKAGAAFGPRLFSSFVGLSQWNGGTTYPLLLPFFINVLTLQKETP